jgi:hypothetical protein
VNGECSLKTGTGTLISDAKFISGQKSCGDCNDLCAEGEKVDGMCICKTVRCTTSIVCKYGDVCHEGKCVDVSEIPECNTMPGHTADTGFYTFTALKDDEKCICKKADSPEGVESCVCGMSRHSIALRYSDRKKQNKTRNSEKY